MINFINFVKTGLFVFAKVVIQIIPNSVVQRFGCVFEIGRVYKRLKRFVLSFSLNQSTVPSYLN